MEVIMLDGEEHRRVARWKRSVLVGDDGTVFLPAFLGGNEQSVWLCATFDGVPISLHAKHLYVPADWLGRNYPRTSDLCISVVNRLTREGFLSREDSNDR